MIHLPPVTTFPRLGVLSHSEATYPFEPGISPRSETSHRHLRYLMPRRVRRRQQDSTVVVVRWEDFLLAATGRVDEPVPNAIRNGRVDAPRALTQCGRESQNDPPSPLSVLKLRNRTKRSSPLMEREVGRCSHVLMFHKMPYPGETFVT